MIFLISILAVFFALNMGGASFAASFAASYGGKILPRKTAGLLFIGFVILGAWLFGENVSVTLGQGIMPADLISPKALAIIFFSAGLSMFAANLMKIPQSTSLVTVAAIAGVGAHYQEVNLQMIYYLIPFWVLLPALSYLLTHFLTGLMYPPRKGNYWVYEKFINQRDKLKKFVIISSCYNAFAVGSNNVPNVAGPLSSAGILGLLPALLIFAVFYGAGAFTFTGPIKTAGDKIVPLGLLTASIISMVSGTLMIGASACGVPQSFVMLQMGAIFAVSSLKDGHRATFNNPLTQKTLYTWTVNPVITFLFSWGSAWILKI